MIERPVTTPTPRPPFEPLAAPSMTLDEAIEATRVFFQAFIGAQNAYTALVNAKTRIQEAEALAAQVDTLTAQCTALRAQREQLEATSAARRAEIDSDLAGRMAEAEAHARVASDQKAALAADVAALERTRDELMAGIAALKSRLG